VREHQRTAGIESADDPARGFDHGTFVVTGVAWPQADIPTFQLSLKVGLDPAEHLQIGRALAPLRDEGVLILGSGMSYHNMQGFRMMMSGGAPPSDDSRAFHDWLADAMTHEASGRASRLAEWEAAPRARACHPREEHLLPLMVTAGAGEDGAATMPFRDTVLGVDVCAIQFG
jgi:aromatic ring-opening dioxygenase catalytic subunit (LigB family)